MANARESLLEGKTSGYRAALPNAMHLFDRIDADGDGVLTMQEIQAYLKKQGMRPGQINSLLAAMDPEHQTVSVLNFLAVLAQKYEY
jgi:hypothetical protein